MRLQRGDQGQCPIDKHAARLGGEQRRRRFVPSGGSRLGRGNVTLQLAADDVPYNSVRAVVPGPQP